MGDVKVLIKSLVKIFNHNDKAVRSEVRILSHSDMLHFADYPQWHDLAGNTPRASAV